MRIFVLLPIAAAATATAAIGAWGPGFASSRIAALDQRHAHAMGSRHAAPATIETLRPRSISIASAHYRAEACSGDYVCGEDGAWEVVQAVAR